MSPEERRAYRSAGAAAAVRLATVFGRIEYRDGDLDGGRLQRRLVLRAAMIARERVYGDEWALFPAPIRREDVSGMKQLFEVLRWQHARATKGDSFKLNNSLTSRYARLLVELHPELDGVFEMRALRSVAA